MKARLNFGIVIFLFFVMMSSIGFCNFKAMSQTNDSMMVTNSTTTIMELTPFQPIPFQPLNLGEPTDQTQTSPNSGFKVPENNDDENKNNDLILLNQKYNNERFDRIVGELLNNGTETASFVSVSVSFYDEDGVILGSVSGITEPSSIPPGGKTAFDILITSKSIDHDAERYEFSFQWSDDDFNQHTVRITDLSSTDNDNDDD